MEEQRYVVNINCQPYPVKLTLVYDRELFEKKASKLIGYTVQTDGCDGMCADKEGKYLVGIFDNKVGTVAHELNHVCISVFEYIGLPISDSNSEAYCYFFEHLIKQAIGDIKVST